MLEANRRQGSSRVELCSKSQPSLKLLCLLDPSDKVKESEHHCQIYRPKPEISADCANVGSFSSLLAFYMIGLSETQAP